MEVPLGSLYILFFWLVWNYHDPFFVRFLPDCGDASFHYLKDNYHLIYCGICYCTQELVK